MELHYATLMKIENDYPNKCKMGMLEVWLQQQDDVPQKGVLSWSVLQGSEDGEGVSGDSHQLSHTKQTQQGAVEAFRRSLDSVMEEHFAKIDQSLQLLLQPGEHTGNNS